MEFDLPGQWRQLYQQIFFFVFFWGVLDHLKPVLLLEFFLSDTRLNFFISKNSFVGLIQLIFFHGSPTYCPGGLSLKFGVCQTLSKKVMKPSAASIDLWNVYVKSFPKWYGTCILDEIWGLWGPLKFWLRLIKVQWKSLNLQRSGDFSNGVRGCP